MATQNGKSRDTNNTSHKKQNEDNKKNTQRVKRVSNTGVNRSARERQVDINICYGFSLLHIFSLVLQPSMSAYIRKTDGVYISVPKND